MRVRYVFLETEFIKEFVYFWHAGGFTITEKKIEEAPRIKLRGLRK